MSDYSGYLWLIDERNRAAAIRESIEDKRTFTDTVSSLDWRVKQAEVFLLSLDKVNLHFACLARSGKNVATQKRRLKFSNFVELEPPIQINTLKEQIPKNSQVHFVVSSSGAGDRITPRTWENIIAAVKEMRPNCAKQLDALLALRHATSNFRSKAGIETVAQERDAINLSLRLADIDPIKIVDYAPPVGRLIPFIVGLKDSVAIEDLLIQRDMRAFGDWQEFNHSIVGTALFHKNDEQLLVMNVNRTNVEKTLGVDLIYYFEKFQSYILVQYKRMLRENSGLCYRPLDKSYKQEIARMEKLERTLAHNQPQLRLPIEFDPLSYRLHGGVCYFKLCPAEIKDLTSPEMIPGLYIPLDYWKVLIESDDTTGSKGGKCFSYETVKRYFCSSFFVELSKAGWVGSKLEDTELITKHIELALRNKKSVVLSALLSNNKNRNHQ